MLNSVYADQFCFIQRLSLGTSKIQNIEIVAGIQIALPASSLILMQDTQVCKFSPKFVQFKAHCRLLNRKYL